MEETKRKSEGILKWMFPMVLGAIAFNVGSNIGSYKPEEPKITRTEHEGFQVKCDAYLDRTVVMIQDNTGRIRIHGVDRGNDGRVDYAEPLMGYRGTGSDLELLQSGYEATRKSDK